MTTITRAQYYQLMGLQLIAKRHNEALDELTKAVNAITKEDSDMGHSWDFTYGQRTVDELLQRLDLTVESLPS